MPPDPRPTMRSKGQPIRPAPPGALATANADAPEHWAVERPGGDVAQLHVPPALRDRHFEVFCSLQVRYGGAAGGGDESDGAWHAMRVTVNGAQEWSRRLPTESGSDSMDYRFRRVVPAGEALRIVVTTEVHRAVRQMLRVTVDEEGWAA